ncbi:hypothetical protein [Bacillus sp. EB600]|uniref:hypothetical protein n=1 Tax=Bacillus sp. EB600 TaxID=2806345 RepID=UPI00210B582B|nr:hypothetical protein [Bacillus sp. EB600]MCQ6281079.1 hypothetical protein [Bacillus sp. EB600]
MKFDLEKFTVDEFSDGTKLHEWISKNYFTEDAELPGLLKIPVMDWDDELNDYVLIEGFEWLEEDIGHNTEIWVCWDEDDGKMLDWWITGDNC